MDLIAEEMCSVSVQYFDSYPMMESIRYSQIPRCVYPKTSSEMLHYDDISRSPYSPADIKAEMPLVTKPTIYEVADLSGVKTYVTKPVFGDEGYIFSRDFYDNRRGMSHLEIQVRNMILDQPLDRDTLMHILDTIHTWKPKDQIYYIPIVIWLSKYHLGRGNL
jgi:hypothetical protein